MRKFSGARRPVEQNAPTNWNAVGLQDVAPSMQVEDVADEHIANIVLNDDVRLAHRLEPLEKHAQVFRLLDITILSLLPDTKASSSTWLR